MTSLKNFLKKKKRQNFISTREKILVLFSTFSFNYQHKSNIRHHGRRQTWSIHEKPGPFANINTRNNVWDLPTIHQWSHFSQTSSQTRAHVLFLFLNFSSSLFVDWNIRNDFKKDGKMDKASTAKHRSLHSKRVATKDESNVIRKSNIEKEKNVNQILNEKIREMEKV